MTCRKCGGQRSADHCNLCDLFASGNLYDGVERRRANNPKEILALGVHPTQIPEFREKCRRAGVRCDWSKDGYPIAESRRHQKAIMNAINPALFNKDGGFSD